MLLSIRSQLGSRASPSRLPSLVRRFNCLRTIVDGWIRSFSRAVQHARGQGLVEYALILVLVAVVVIASLTVLGERVYQVYDQIQCTLAGGEWHQDAGAGNSNKCKGVKKNSQHSFGGGGANSAIISHHPILVNDSL